MCKIIVKKGCAAIEFSKVVVFKEAEAVEIICKYSSGKKKYYCELIIKFWNIIIIYKEKVIIIFGGIINIYTTKCVKTKLKVWKVSIIIKINC